jgi:hypothetical protein
VDFGRATRGWTPPTPQKSASGSQDPHLGIPTHPHADSEICDHNYTAPANEQGPAPNFFGLCSNPIQSAGLFTQLLFTA